jgi:hypothetical protein
MLNVSKVMGVKILFVQDFCFSTGMSYFQQIMAQLQLWSRRTPVYLKQSSHKTHHSICMHQAEEITLNTVKFLSSCSHTLHIKKLQIRHIPKLSAIFILLFTQIQITLYGQLTITVIYFKLRLLQLIRYTNDVY